MYQGEIRKLKHELDERDLEITSLRTQKDELKKALQENIFMKSNRSFGRGFEELAE
jgi:SMC interacting uncharacterized protein involved in chromosome segregation